jgi:MSHA biogenesis protein MshP
MKAGFSIVSALFLVLILSLIASYAVSLSGLTRATSTLSLQGTRAYYAARSGLEWGIYNVTTGSFNCPAGSANNTCPSGYTGSIASLTLSEANFKGFSVTVNCCQNSITEGNLTYNVFLINAQSQYGTGSAESVSRRLYTMVVDPRG